MTQFKNVIIALFLISNIAFTYNANGEQECQAGRIIPGYYIAKHKPEKFSKNQTVDKTLLAQNRAKKLKENNLKLEYSVESLKGETVIVSAVNAIAIKNIENLILKKNSDFEYIIPVREICPLGDLKVSGRIRMKNASTPLYPPSISYYTLSDGSERFMSLSGSGAIIEGKGQAQSEILYWPKQSSLWDGNDDGLADLISNTYAITPSFSDYVLDGYVLNSWASDGQGTFNENLSHEFPNGLESFNSIALTDFDNDDKQDTLIASRNSLLLKSKDQYYPIRKFDEDIQELNDFDMDGDIDVISFDRRMEQSEEYFGGYTIYKVYLNSNGVFNLSSIFEKQEMKYDFERDIKLTTADFDYDGDNDIVSIYNEAGYDGFIGLHKYQNSQYEKSGYVRLMFGAEPFYLKDIVIQDIDGDGQIDIASSNLNSECLASPLGIWRNFGFSIKAQPDLIQNFGCVDHFILEDYNADGRLDIIFSSDDSLKIAINNSLPGKLSFENPVTLSYGLTKNSHIFPFDPAAIGGALITLTGPSGITRKTFSDMRGQFEFKGLPSGNYSINAIREGYHLINEDIDNFTLASDKVELNYGALKLIPELGSYTSSTSAPNDQAFSLMWGLENKGQAQGISGIDIKVLQAWKINQGDPEHVIAVLDSGIDYNHVDLVNNIWRNNKEIPDNNFDDDNNGFIDDYFGIDSADNDSDPNGDRSVHGTHVAGTIAATTNNSIGVSGVCPNCKVMAVKVFSSLKSSTDDASIIKGIDYVINQSDRGVKIDAINASLGSVGECVQAYLDIFNEMNKRGITFVASAGNGGEDGEGDNNDEVPSTPTNCNSPNLISVANIDNTGILNQSSNYGLTTVDIAAPGTDIVSTAINGLYTSLTGTSMAAPHVAGVVGLIRSHNPNLTPNEILNIIINTATKVSQLNGKIVSGGILNATAALEAASVSVTPQIPTSTPTPTKFPMIEFSFSPKAIKSKGGVAKFKAVFEPAKIENVWVLLTAGKKNKKVKLKLKKSKKSSKLEYKGSYKFSPPKGQSKIKSNQSYQTTLFVKIKDGEIISFLGQNLIVGNKNRSR